MNIIETIYCSQYHEIKKQGKDPIKGRLNGTLLSATVIILTLIIILVAGTHFSLLIIPADVRHSVRDSGFTGKFIGKMLGLVGMIVIGGGLYYTYGSEAHYRKMMQSWEQLPETVLDNTVSKALKIFGVTFGVFLLVVLLWAR